MQSKRFVWNTVEASFRDSRGAILTTHSMEEADALCSRVGIMVKGELRCLGSTQHLKNKYGAGYMLEVKWRAGSAADWPLLEDFLAVSSNTVRYRVGSYRTGAAVELSNLQ